MSGDRNTVTAVTAVTSVVASKGPAPGTMLLGKYRVDTMLGFGGMGLVVRAHNIALDEHVAIKFLREDVQLDDEHVERFLREAKACVRLKSEHVAKIRDVGTLENGRPYMAMELLEGQDLGKLLLDQGAIDPARAVDLLLQACDAIAEAHVLGIIHRDLKPTNLFITRRRDDSELLKVLDFGISKASSGPEMSLTQTSSMLGTPAYMSPEQMRSARTADPRSDIWALGTVLYELVEGRLPFAATNFAELCVMVATEPPAPMTRAPHLQNVVNGCLAKPLEQRFQDIGDLAVQLEPFASDAGRAQRQVQRIQRVLGKAPGRDSTPMPMTMTRASVQNLHRDSVQRIGGTPIPGMPLPPTPSPVARPNGMWKSIVLLVVLFGVGIAGGLYVTQGTEPAPVATTPGSGAAIVPGLVDASVAVETIEPPAPPAPIDAGLPVAAPPVATPPVATPPRRPPPRRPPTRPPPRTPTRTEPVPTPAPVPVPVPPVKKCDPFANAKGC